MKWLKIGSVLCVLCILGCQTSPSKPLSQIELKSLAAEKFNQLYANFYRRDDIGQVYYPVAKLSADDFSIIESTNEGVLVEYATPAGWYVKCKIAPNGEYVDVLEVDFVTE